MSKGKDKERLKALVNSEINLIQKQILDVVEVAVESSRWIPLRKRILDITNKSRRNMENQIEMNYDVDYNPATICEDIIEVRPITVYPIKNKQRKGIGNEGSSDGESD